MKTLWIQFRPPTINEPSGPAHLPMREFLVILLFYVVLMRTDNLWPVWWFQTGWSIVCRVYIMSLEGVCISSHPIWNHQTDHKLPMYINTTLNNKITRNCLPTYKNIKTREYCQWKFSENVLTLLAARGEETFTHCLQTARLILRIHNKHHDNVRFLVKNFIGCF